MATYLCLLRWTKEGVANVKDSPSRLDAGKRAFAAAGCSRRVTIEVADVTTYVRLLHAGLGVALLGARASKNCDDFLFVHHNFNGFHSLKSQCDNSSVQGASG